MINIICILLTLEAVVGQVVYDAYFGKPLSDAREKYLTQSNATGPCTILVKPCTEEEGRRVDGTCANPKYPSRGGTATPLLRMLPARFGLGNTLRPAANGSELPSTRIIRTKILTEGYVKDHEFSMLLTHVFVFSFVDHVDLEYLVGFAIASDCCIGNTPNRANPRCIAIPVPWDDPTLRRTDVRCLNCSRINTFQEMGCIPNTLPAERYSKVTPLLDLSVVYGNTDERNKQIRANQGGLLLAEEKEGKEYPPSSSAWCIQNRRPAENSCFGFGDDFHGNALTGILKTSLWFFREHNRLARGLARVNPCWSDEQLFQTARKINIAQWQYIYYYELIKAVLGWENSIRAGILYETHGYVNDFDERLKPGVYHEHVTGGRWFHSMQDARFGLYSNKGKFLGARTTVDDAFRSGILDYNTTEADLTQGAIRQPAGKMNWNMHYDFAERIFGELQTASDLPAIDILRGRDAGLPPYNEYRKICGLPYAHKWDDFKDVIWPDKVEQLKRLYDEVDDLDLMAAIYSEKLLPGAWVGPTLFCIMARNLVDMRRSDRHFFEQGVTSAALTLDQLNEVRKTSAARLLCDNGNNVDSIQPHAFYIPGKGNEIVTCKNIPGIDLSKWEDPVCEPTRNKDEKKKENYGIKYWLDTPLFGDAVVGHVVYDTYFGKPLSETRRRYLSQANATALCTIEVEPCKEDEGRRLDGTCANPKYPSRGATGTPLLRMLPPNFGLGNTLPPAINGSELPSTRLIRTKILTEGYTEDHRFSYLLTNFFISSAADVADSGYVTGYAFGSDCCAGNTPNRENPRCISIPVPRDDPILRRTGIRCMNCSRIITFQDRGCIPNTLPAERYSRVTPSLDLSLIYGFLGVRNREIRANQGGLLLAVERDGKEYPPSNSQSCPENKRPVENSCFSFGDDFHANALPAIALTSLLVFREHNRLARGLARVNPCWSDEQLFLTARKINIAQWQYIYYYEIISAVLGWENSVEAGILHKTHGYVNDFDEHLKPGVYHEFVTGIRWFHTMQDTRFGLYSNTGKFLGTRTAVDDQFRTGVLDYNTTEADLTQGSFRQPAAKVDWNIDYDLAERVFGGLQAASDLPAIDILRGRDVGLPPYNEYRKICGLPYAHKWEDFEDTLWRDKLVQLKRQYNEVDDVDLMAGIYSEKLMPGAVVGPTLFCIMARNLVDMRRSDRHFFEQGVTPAALTLDQLNEVRKTSAARLLCDNGKNVDSIQPHAFFIPGEGNEIVSCKHIPGINLDKWEDPICKPTHKMDVMIQNNERKYWSDAPPMMPHMMGG
ncbi:peroxidase domain-containing protein [Phthorimaea operculella]|nr:peroxidase domain-containing protein [Phthorimaea operculella]